MAKSAESAIQCPNNLIQTFFEHGLGYPSNVWEFKKRWLFGSRQKLGKVNELMGLFEKKNVSSASRLRSYSLIETENVDDL